MNVFWTPKSEIDLEVIHDGVSQSFSLLKANEVIINIVETVESVLSENPLAGRILESNPLFSFLVVDGNNIFYVENQNERAIYIVYVQARKSNLKIDRLKP